MRKMIDKIKMFIWKHESYISWSIVLLSILGMAYFVISKEIGLPIEFL
jgi:hypothetical protein